jgi:hypothetical protein
VFVPEGALLNMTDCATNGDGSQASGSQARAPVYELCDGFVVPDRPAGGPPDSIAQRPKGPDRSVFLRTVAKHIMGVFTICHTKPALSSWCLWHRSFTYSLIIMGVTASQLSQTYSLIRLKTAVAQSALVTISNVVIANTTAISSSRQRRRQLADSGPDGGMEPTSDMPRGNLGDAPPQQHDKLRIAAAAVDMKEFAQQPRARHGRSEPDAGAHASQLTPQAVWGQQRAQEIFGTNAGNIVPSIKRTVQRRRMQSSAASAGVQVLLQVDGLWGQSAKDAILRRLHASMHDGTFLVSQDVHARCRKRALHCINGSEYWPSVCLHYAAANAGSVEITWAGSHISAVVERPIPRQETEYSCDIGTGIWARRTPVGGSAAGRLHTVPSEKWQRQPNHTKPYRQRWCCIPICPAIP